LRERKTKQVEQRTPQTEKKLRVIPHKKRKGEKEKAKKKSFPSRE